MNFTYQTAEAVLMPLTSKTFDNNIRNWLPALTALGTVPVGMAVATPRIPIFLNERRARVERIATLRAEEVAGMPFCTASNNDLTFDGCLARFAARAEHLVEVEGAVEAQRGFAV